jgi:hypothetical protein
MSSRTAEPFRFLTPGMPFDSIVLNSPEGRMRKTETLNLRVSPEFKRRLIEEARRVNRSVTNYIEAALSEFWILKAPGTRRRTKTKKVHQQRSDPEANSDS